MATQKSSTTKKVIIGGAIVIILGVASYFGYQQYKKIQDKKKAEADELKKRLDEIAKAASSNSSSNNSSSNSSSSSLPSTGLTKEEGLAFRKWINEKYPDYAKSIDLSRVGDPDNKYIREGFAKYGKEWRESLNQATQIPNETNGIVNITPENKARFVAFASKMGASVKLTPKGISYFQVPFTTLDPSVLNSLGTVPKIVFYEQSPTDRTKQTYIVFSTTGTNFQGGTWSNNGLSLTATTGHNKGVKIMNASNLQKAIQSVLGVNSINF